MLFWMLIKFAEVGKKQHFKSPLSLLNTSPVSQPSEFMNSTETHKENNCFLQRNLNDMFIITLWWVKSGILLYGGFVKYDLEVVILVRKFFPHSDVLDYQTPNSSHFSKARLPSFLLDLSWISIF